MFGSSFRYSTQHEPSARLQRRFDVTQHQLRLRELVVDVHHDREIDRFDRQPRIVLRAEDRRDVGQLALRDAAC